MKQSIFKLFAIALILALTVNFLPAQTAYAVSSDIVISQVYGGGGASTGSPAYKYDYVELFNLGTTAVDINGWSLQYGSSTGVFGGATGNLIILITTSTVIQPNQYYLVRTGSPGTAGPDLPVPPDLTSTVISMAAGSGKIALVSNGTWLNCSSWSGCTGKSIVDLVVYGSASNSGEGNTTVNNNVALDSTKGGVRKSGGCLDSDNNNNDFDVMTDGALVPRNSTSPLHYCTGPTNPSGVGAATPNTLFTGDPTLLTVAVTPGTNPPSTGLNVTCDLFAIGGPATQTFYDDGTNGDVTASDNTFSFSTTVAGGTAGGAKSLDCTIGDDQSRSGSATIGLTVTAILPIGTVNGPVGDTDDGTLHRSPYAPASGNGLGSTVVVQGVIYETTLQAISNSTNTYKGFFIQNTAATADSDPNTSDGLFVFMSTASTISGPGGPYTPQVGDEVVLSGKVSEYYNMTELQSLTLVKPVLRSGVDIEAEVPPVVANPPANLADANRYWERLQGMRVQVPHDSIVLGGRNVFSPADAEIWVASPDSTIAGRANPYARKAFRDAHPLDDNYDPTNWDGNGYRILMGSLGIKAAAGDAQALIDPARSYSTVTNAPSGGLNYTFSKYRIEITDQPALSEGVDPAANNPPSEFDRSLHFSIVDYNLENLYDYRDNPFSGCDFAISRQAAMPVVQTRGLHSSPRSLRPMTTSRPTTRHTKPA